MSVSESPGLPKSAFAPPSANAGPLQKNWYGPHRAIGTVSTRASVCIVLVDYATRYPEAVALRNTFRKSVAEALFSMISRVGIRKRFLTDQGTAFMSRTIRELYELLGIKSIRTSVYHPQTDGLVERFKSYVENNDSKVRSRRRQKLGQMAGNPFCSLCARSARLHGVFPLRAPVRPPAPRGFGRPEGDLEEGPSESKNEIQHVLDLRTNSTRWGSSPWRICYRPRTSKAGYTIGGPSIISQFHAGR